MNSGSSGSWIGAKLGNDSLRVIDAYLYDIGAESDGPTFFGHYQDTLRYPLRLHLGWQDAVFANTYQASQQVQSRPYQIARTDTLSDFTFPSGSIVSLAGGSRYYMHVANSNACRQFRGLTASTIRFYPYPNGSNSITCQTEQRRIYLIPDSIGFTTSPSTAVQSSDVISFAMSPVSLKPLPIQTRNYCNLSTAQLHLTPVPPVLCAAGITLRATPPGPDLRWSTGATGDSVRVTRSGRYTVQRPSGCGFVKDSVMVALRPPNPDTLALRILQPPTCTQPGLLTADTLGLGAGTALRSYFNEAQTAISLPIPFAVPGRYRIEAANACGTLSGSLALAASDSCQPLLIPNLVVPDGLPRNRSFFVQGLKQPAQLEIYNRWGGRVYATDAYDNAWAGPVGTYFYLLTMGGNTYKGWVEVTK